MMVPAPGMGTRRGQKAVRKVHDLEPDAEHGDLEVTGVSAGTLHCASRPEDRISLPDRLFEGLVCAGRAGHARSGERGGADGPAQDLHLRFLVFLVEARG